MRVPSVDESFIEIKVPTEDLLEGLST